MSDAFLSRRDFLVYSGATALGVTLGELGRRHLARADALAAEWRSPARERWATSVCRECPAGCGVRVRLIDDVPVKLEGNALCPIARGRLCAKGQAALQAYFDPDRLTGPARRQAGGDTWEPLDWPAAVMLVAEGIRRFGAEPGSILALGVEEHGPVGDAWAQVWAAAGATVGHTPQATASRLRAPLEALTGATGDPLFDLERAQYVLSFGTPIVEDWLSPVWAQRAYGRFRRNDDGSRGRLVQIEGRLSGTARKADEWIVVPADRHAALALAITAVLLREGRADRAFLEAHGGNLREFEHAVARDTPDGLAAATGVPAVTILRLARELTASPQALVVVPADADPRLAGAVLTLNALIGAFDRPGGIFVAPPRTVPPPVAAGAAVPGGGGQPRMVVLRDASALRSMNAPFDVEAAIARAELVVSFSPYLDEASAGAHVLLPVHTPLESWHVFVPATAVPGEQIAIAPPAVAPRLDTRDLPEALRVLGDAVGGGMAAGCTWTSSADLAGELVTALAGERRGTPYCTPYETSWIVQLERGGWWTPTIPDGHTFAGTVQEAGGWTDPFFDTDGIRRALRARGGLSFTLPLPQTAGPAASGGEDFPLRAFPFTPALVNLTGSPNQPSLLELLGPLQSHPWHVWAELNPDTAHRLGVREGARITLASAHGRIEAVAAVVERMPPDIVAVAWLPAVPQGGRWARELVVDARRLWPRGAPPSGPVAVQVRRG
jgi:anaerobic selenocysteine-containing dehydrogenase